MNAHIEKLTFTGSQGDALAARFDRPLHTPRAIALLAHCFTCSKDIAAASRISARLVDAGFAVLRFDFTGLGSSEGEFANTNFSSNVADLVAAADHLRSTHGAPDLLIGHSLGGAAVLAAAAQIPEVGAVATIGAPSDPSHVTGLLDDETRAAIESSGEANVTLAGRQFTIKKQFLEDVQEQRLTEIVAAMGQPLLVMHSPIDDVVSIDHARTIFDAAKHPKSFVSLDIADHLLTNRDDAAFVADILATWSSRHLDIVDAEAATAGTPVAPIHEPPPEGKVLVEETHAEDHHFAQRVLAGRHHLLADEPIGIGDDSGPTPYDYLLAGLGTCTSMTLRMYADRKKLPLEHVRVTLQHDRIHADDCIDDRGAPCKIEQLTRRIELIGDDLTADERTRLLEIADKCPVHRTLEGDIRISTELVAEARD